MLLNRKSKEYVADLMCKKIMWERGTRNNIGRTILYVKNIVIDRLRKKAAK